MREVADAVRGMPAMDAQKHLGIMAKNAAKPLSGVIKSAIANAKEKNAKEDMLTLHTVEVMEGPVMKRWRAVSRGRAHGYKKRMSHVRIVLSDEAKETKEDKQTKGSKE